MNKLIPRVIPTLLLKGESLVKTVNFKKFSYIGDPCNTVRIFNELETDELIFLDISVSINKEKINYDLLKDISNECFMPLGYGGGINSLSQAKKIFDIGYEKIVINTSTYKNPQIITELSNYFGSQAIIVSIDIKKNFFGKLGVYFCNGQIKSNYNPIDWAVQVESLGAGEILLNCIDNEGTWNGFNEKIIAEVSNRVKIPVIASGGASSVSDIKSVIKNCNASAVALGNMVVYQKKDMGVLINYKNINF